MARVTVITVSGFITTIEMAVLGFIAATYRVLGWPGLILLMAIESTFIPLPSELVVPFASWELVVKQNLGWWGVVLIGLAAAFGSWVGSAVEYWISRIAGRKFLEKYGKYLLLVPEDLDRTDKLFAKRGDWVIFIARLIPGVRGVISIPAGVARMNFVKFSIYTFAGALVWCLILAWLGYILGDNYEEIREFLRPVEIPLFIIIATAILFFIVHRIVKVVRSSKKRRP